MRVDLLRPADLTPGEIRAWEDLMPLAGVVNSPFLSPHFSVAVGEQRPAVRVAMVVDDGAPVAFLAHEYQRGGIARPVGAGLSDYQAIVAPADRDLDVAGLLDSAGVRIWEFDHLAAGQATRLDGVPHRLSSAVSPVIDLRGGFDHYRETVVSRSLFPTTARHRRRLEREAGEVRFTARSPEHAHLDRLLAWKSDQYRRTGRRDRFADPAHRRLLHRLLDLSTPSLSGGLAVLSAAGAPVAAVFYLRAGDVISYWFPAYDPDFSHYSPGLLLLVDLAREMADTGVGLIDLGKGREPYKDRFATGSHTVLEGHVAPRRSTLAAWRLYRAPRDAALGWVLASEVRRRRARAALRWLGALRQSASGTGRSGRGAVSSVRGANRRQNGSSIGFQSRGEG